MDLFRAGDPDEEPADRRHESGRLEPDLDAADEPVRSGPVPTADASSSRLAWLLGTGGLIIPFLSLAGMWSGYRAAHRGNHRAGGLAVVWCLLTLSISIALWGPLFLGGTWRAPTTYSLVATGLQAAVEPPAGLGFAASGPTASYAELDLTIRNRSGDAVPFSPSSIEVSDRTGSRLAWATDDEVFLTTSELPARSSQQVHIWVALPAGRAVASIQVGDSRIEVR